MDKGWEHVEHQADIGVLGWGGTVAEAFEQAALAMMAVIVDPGLVKPVSEVEVQCSASDLEMLLADWLGAVLCEMSERRMLFSRFEVEIKDGGLRGKAWGETIEPERHKPAVEVKGASYLGLKVEQRADGMWMAECVVDV
jgi:SHS2 domain-containing protein